MLLTDKQTEKWVEWFKETYGKYCEKDENWRLWIPTIYSDNPEETEKEHMEMWKNKIKELMWRNANKKYTHRGGRTESYADAQFNSLWLYNWPYFKHNDEKAARCIEIWKDSEWNIIKEFLIDNNAKLAEWFKPNVEYLDYEAEVEWLGRVSVYHKVI